MHKFILGVDIGGSKILSGIITPEGQIVARKKEPTFSARPVDEILDGICASLGLLMEEAGIVEEEILGVAVGAPGPLNYRSGIIKDPPNLNWRNLPLRDELSKRLGRQLLLENDANLAALGEWKFGKAMLCSNLVYMTVSTGIGGGIIAAGSLYRGRDGGAGEIGRMMMEPPQGSSSKDLSSCLEDLASGTAIARAALAVISEGHGQVLLGYANGSKITAQEVGRAARDGVPAALEIINKAGLYLGMAAANLVNIFNPDRFVVGGGVGLGLQDLLAPPIQEGLMNWAAPSLRQGLTIEFTGLGEDICLLGCAAAIGLAQ